MKRPPGTPIFFGWKVTAAVFVIAMFAWGIGFYGPSVFLVEISRTRGWAVSLVSAAVTAHFLLSALVVACLGDLHQRFGLAPVTFWGVALTAAGVLAWGNANAPWHLFLAAALTGAGYATTSGAAINAMVSPWFDKRRPLALAWAYNGASIGGVVFVPLWVTLIGWQDFATAATIVAGASIAVLWPLTWSFLRPTPGSKATFPDGEPGPDGETPATQRRAPILRRDLLRDRRFVTLAAAFALALFAQTGVIAHLLARLASVLGQERAAMMVSLTVICAVTGRVLLGSLIGEGNRRSAAALNFAIQAAGVLFIALGQTTWQFATGCILFGIGLGNVVSLPPLIAQHEFDRADVMRVIGLSTSINHAVFAFSPFVLGALKELTGDYRAAFSVAVAFQVCAIIAVLTGRGKYPGIRS
jgi:MFS family permease